MHSPLFPSNNAANDLPLEPARLAALRSLKLLDTPPDGVLDGLARSAAALLDCPIALITLIDDQRLWFKARVGMAAAELGRSGAFCAETILSGELLEVPNASLDPRFDGSELVTGAAALRFYAGVSLAVDGHRVGTLCVLDRQPRQLSDKQRSLLRDLARAVEQWLVSWREHNDLRELEAYRRNLFEQLGDGVLLFDSERRIVDANPCAESMLGYRRPELLKLRLDDVLGQVARQRIDSLPAALADDKLLVEWDLLRKDGQLLAAEVSARPLDGERHLAVVRDISQRHAQELQLRQLSLAVEQSSEGIVITDADANIEYLNACALASFGYSREELIGRNARILQSGQTPIETLRSLRAAVLAQQPWKGLLFNQRKDGSEYVAFTKTTPIRMPDGRITHFLTLIEDVTDKQRLGAELDHYRHHLEELVSERTAALELATQAAEAANVAKSEFLATMSHEIRTPMNGVVGTVDVLRQSNLTPYQAELTDTIRESAMVLLHIIDDLLDFSKIEAGRLVVENEPLALLRLVEGVCDNLQPVAASREVGLQAFVDPSLPDWIMGDAMRLRQILNNLVGNAIKFSAGLPKPGQVRLRVEPGLPGQLRMSVSDNGIGITPEAQTRIFEPFTQAEGSTTRRYGGTGLGLSICSRLVQLSGGDIQVFSIAGQGSVFSVTLPLETPTAEFSRELTALPWPDLSGLVCHVALPDGALARDWCRYLQASGAHAQAWPNLGVLQQVLAVPSGVKPVVIVDARSAPQYFDAPDTAGAEPSMALVRIGQGMRRSARLVRPGLVSLDVDAVHRAALVQTVAMAAGRLAPPVSDTPTARPLGVTAPLSEDEAAAQGRLVLVAEDNEINRKVIRRQLALLGVTAELADDGIDALARWRHGRHTRRYGLLLTDLHMPGMDGYELTTHIRSLEVPGEHLPIVALTANALRDRAERCSAVGMDDYLSKPVQLGQLAATLSRWLPPAPTPPASAGQSTAQRLAQTAMTTAAMTTAAMATAAMATAEAATAATTQAIQPEQHGSQAPPAPYPEPADALSSVVLDESALAALIGAEPEVLAEFQREFLRISETTAQALREAAEQGQWAQAGALAHRLKSSARAVGALALSDCCGLIEQTGGLADGAALRQHLVQFEAALADVQARLNPAAATRIVLPESLPPGPTVVLVDDDPFQLQLLQQQLATLGVARVQACTSGAAALEFLKDCSTEAMLLMLDLNMPRMDGIDFIHLLAQRRYAGALALVSGSDAKALETAATLALENQLTVLGSLSKPLTRAALARLVERWRTLNLVQAQPADLAQRGLQI